MAIDNFKPTIWAARIINKLNNSHVYAQGCNRDYEGDITAAGDTVVINGIGPVTVSPYTGSVSYEAINDASRVLQINQANYWAIDVDDVDAAQANMPLLEKTSQQAAWGVRNVVDLYIAAMHGDAGSFVDDGGSAIDVNSANVIDVCTRITQALDEANCPDEGRWIVAPPWFIRKMRLAAIFDTGSYEALTSGQAINAEGFSWRKSNNVANSAGSSYKIMAGTERAISYAEQLLNVEALRLESAFADALRGLHAFGAKVIDPQCLCTATVDELAEAA